MPFAYLRKQRESASLHGNPAPRGVSLGKAVRIALVAVVLVPLALWLPWLHSALGPSGLPDHWVRSSPGLESECGTVTHDGAALLYCEDIEAIPGTSTVLVSCDANRPRWNTVMGPLTDPGPRGTLYAYSLNGSKQAVPVELTGYPREKDFHPLGMSMFTGSKGTRLFVVNHARDRSTVEVFDLVLEKEGWVAKWVRDVVHVVATHTPNSIHALSSTSFVVTNDHLFARRPGPLAHTLALLHHLILGSYDERRSDVLTWTLLQVAKVLTHRGVAARLAQIETLLGLPLGWVSFVDLTTDVDARILARGIPFANGITLTPDNKLAVAATTYPGIYFYSYSPPHPSSSPLHLHSKLHLPFRVDNLALSVPPRSAGDDAWGGRVLLATGHPAPLKLMAMSRNVTNRAPSWSVAITPFSGADEWEDKAAPLPAHRFVLSHNPAWSVRTLFQSNASPATPDRPSLASSASTFYRPYDHHPHAGTLLVSGLYDSLLQCSNVST